MRLISLGLLLALSLAPGHEKPYVALDANAEPLKDAFNADAGKVRLVMYVSPTCGGCLRGAKQSQEGVLTSISNPNLRVYVVWAAKNGGREQDVTRVTSLVTDPRAAQYWDGHRVMTDAYDRMLNLTGPCAGIFMLYGPRAHWDAATPPKPDYLEDAHAGEFNRPYPQFDPARFAKMAQGMLGTAGP